MKQLQALLKEGRGHAARNRLEELLRQQPDKTDAAAQAMAKMLAEAYDRGWLRGVHEFCEGLDLELPAAVSEAIEAAVGPRIARTREWMNRLPAVTRERLMRECRGHVVTNQPKPAALAAASLIQMECERGEHDAVARLLGRGLADLERDRERSRKLIEALGRLGGVIATVVPDVLRHFEAACREPGTRQFQSGDQVWRAELIEAILALRPYLPGPNEAGPPTDEQVETFRAELLAIVHAAKALEPADALIDALSILVEYCPADPRALDNVAGVEDRMFLQLGPRARLVAVRALGLVGELEEIRKPILKLFDAAGEPARRGLLMDVMGGLRHPDFLTPLKRELEQGKDDAVLARAAEAISRLNRPEACKLLVTRLGRFARGMNDPRNERRAADLIVAIGRMVRMRAMEAPLRNEVVRAVIKQIDHGARHFRFRAAEQLFSNRIEEFDPALVNWAAARIVEAMWGQPPSKVDAAHATQHGWRQPMVEALKRLGRPGAPGAIEAARPLATRYGGGMGAFADAIEAIGDEQAVDVLEAMARTALTHNDEDDARGSSLTRDHSVDVEAGQLVGLNRDDLVHSLLHALLEVGGSRAEAIVLDFADQVQAGRLALPGDLTSQLLMDRKVASGTIGRVNQVDEVPEVDPDRLKRAISDARGGLMSGKQKRIAAIAELGSMRAPESIGVLVEGLGEKDPMVRTAAETALGGFLQPLPGESAFSRMLDAIFEKPGRLKGRTLSTLLGFIRREMPKNPPYNKVFERQVAVMIDDEALAHRLNGAMRRENAASSGMDESSPAASGTPDKQENAKKGSALSDLDKKRAYIEARRAWIQGGKQGPPPEPPQ